MMLAVGFPLMPGHFDRRELQAVRQMLDKLIDAMGERSQKTVTLYRAAYDKLQATAERISKQNGVATPNCLKYRGVILVRGVD